MRSPAIRFVNIAKGSLEESRRCLRCVHNLAYGDVSKPNGLIAAAGKLLGASMRAILNSDS